MILDHNQSVIYRVPVIYSLNLYRCETSNLTGLLAKNLGVLLL